MFLLTHVMILNLSSVKLKPQFFAEVKAANKACRRRGYALSPSGESADIANLKQYGFIPCPQEYINS